jgi:hypothetical protein
MHEERNSTNYQGTSVHWNAFQVTTSWSWLRECKAVKAKGGYFEESQIENIF